MKYILKITVFIFALLPFISCTNDKDPIVSKNAFEVRQDTAFPNPSVLLPANDNDVFAKLDWDKSNNGVPSVSTYTVLVSDHDSDPNYTNPVEYSGLGLVVDEAVGTRTCKLKVSEMNALLNQLPSYKCGIMNIDIRIKSILGVNPTSEYFQYSNPITLAITSYSTKVPVLAFARDTDTASTSPKLAASNYTSSSDYQGFMYLEAGFYRFYQPDPCGDFSGATVYGVAGTTLVIGGTNGYNVANAGFYFIKANLTVGSMSFTAIPFTNVGAFGPATGLSSFLNVPMTYDASDKKFKLTFEFKKGLKFKFRLLNGTTAVNPQLILGGNTATANSIIEAGSDIPIPGLSSEVPPTQKYDVVLDLNNPRQYTYTLTLNPN